MQCYYRSAGARAVRRARTGGGKHEFPEELGHAPRINIFPRTRGGVILQ